MNSRRDFLVLLGSGALGMPLARAQVRSPGKPFRIGLFPILRAFLPMMEDAMSAAGWRHGRDYVFVQAADASIQPSASEVERLIGLKADLLLVATTAHAIVAHRVTSDIPIVMWTSGYPVEAGLAASLARPGKNVTGVTTYAGTGIWGKLIELLRDAKPAIGRIGVAWGIVPPMFPTVVIEQCYRELRQAAHALKLGLHITEIARAEDLPAGLKAIEAAKPDALLVAPGTGFWDERRQVIQFAAARRIPTIVDWRWPASDALQPLLMYAPSIAALMHQAAPYVVRILEGGAKPGELPIQQPTKFDLVVNLKTAKAIGLTIPQTLLVRADEVIE